VSAPRAGRFFGALARLFSTPPPTAASTARSGPAIEDLIARAALLTGTPLAAASAALAQRFAAAFDRAGARGRPANLFVYHVDLPAGTRLDYPDVAMDVARFDHRAVLEHFLERKRRFMPQAQVFLATSAGSPLRALAAEDVSVVELEADPAWPMYHRALAMHGYALSSAFDADTAFLDSDAFLNRALDQVFALDFDVALTYRADPGLMPVNEGVIFARAARPDAVRDFFARFVATYDAVAVDEAITAYYGDVRRWRGGQLSLNALAAPLAPFSPYRRDTIGGATLRLLPCDTFNYSWDDTGAVRLADRVIVHLKGARKDSLAALRAALEAPREPDADRRYSLDSTPPEDYEPPATLDYAAATLTQIADHFKTDKGSIKHRYAETYERYFAAWRGKPVDLLEIGVACGASLKTWATWLGGDARITGVDVRPECAGLCKRYPQIEIVIADATAWDPGREFDLVVDDGSHVSLDIVQAFQKLWPRVRRGGYYAIEDLRCTHDPGYAKSFTFPKAPEAFRREHFLAWLDQGLRRMDYGAGEMEFLHVYPQLMIIRKR
jgi:hypothetical protein